MKNKTNRNRLIVLIIIFLISLLVFATCALGVFGNPIKDLWLMFFYTIVNVWCIGSVIAVKPKIWIKLLVFIVFELLPIAIYGIAKIYILLIS